MDSKDHLPPNHTIDPEMRRTSTISFQQQQTTLHPSIKPYAGRLGGVQDFVLDRSDPQNAAILSRVPDAAPLMSVRETLSLQGFAQKDIWEAALCEALGTLLFVYLTAWISAHPPPPPFPPPPATQAGIYATASFLGPLIGGITTWILLTVFIYTFSPISGAHLNPLISIATFCARLTTFPRMTLYVVSQTVGATLAGLMLRASLASRNLEVGGCSIDTALISVGEAFAVEFMACLTLLFLAFGVGLDPRQKQVFGPTLAPALVGLAVGVMLFGTAIGRPGYGGAGMNPTRCFGVFVGTRWKGWHWVHWVGALAASVVHSVFYILLPPWTYQKD